MRKVLISRHEIAFFIKKEKFILHRINAPALMVSNGYNEWFRNGVLHRDGGSAIEWGTAWDRITKNDPIIYNILPQSWYKNGKRHRIGGPAIICSDGSVEWWINGKKVSVRMVLDTYDIYNYNNE